MPLDGVTGSPLTAQPAEAASAQSTRASYVRPTPTPPAPRMVMDEEAAFSFDWARKAAQAVVAHARFMDWVERPKDGAAAETPGVDHGSAVGAYGEFGDSGAGSVSSSSQVVMRGPERAG